MAEVKKQCLEYKEKFMILKLSLQKYEKQLQDYLNFLKKMKDYRNFYELDGEGNKTVNVIVILFITDFQKHNFILFVLG